jgi:hypothetical protein
MRKLVSFYPELREPITIKTEPKPILEDLKVLVDSIVDRSKLETDVIEQNNEHS